MCPENFLAGVSGCHNTFGRCRQVSQDVPAGVFSKYKPDGNDVLLRVGNKVIQIVVRTQGYSVTIRYPIVGTQTIGQTDHHFTGQMKNAQLN